MTAHRSDAIRALLSRVLGPPGPEVSCDDCFEYLDRYAELEISGLDPERAIPGMAAHLEGCPACKDDLDALREFVRSHEG